MDKIKVVIVDSGLRQDLIEKADSDCIMVADSQGNSVIEKAPASYGHGTAIYSIIKHRTKNIEIYNIKVKDIEDGITDSDLIYVLRYINRNIPADIINLSLGICSCDNKQNLYEECERLINKGVIIVSAFDNSGMITYPAAFSNVIGVVSDERCVKVADYICYNNTIVNIGAKGDMQRVNWVNPSQLYLCGNSLACAHVTAQVVDFCSKGIRKLQDILSEFNKISKVQYCSEIMPSEGNNVSYSIKRAAVYPFNKEMHSLIRFSDLLSFDIVDVYDSKYSATVGISTNRLMKAKNPIDYIVKNISEIDWESFDTLIIGHIQRLSTLTNRIIPKKELIHEALARGKNVYMFDNYDFSESCPSIFYPRVSDKEVPHTPFGMLHAINRPVIGVFGTSSSQGKFTLQLELRKRFIEAGYQIAQIGTEPQSLLFGIDCCLPFGYNSTVQIDGYDMIEYLNYNISQMCDQGKDIILAGGQAGVLNYGDSNLQQYNINFYSFFLGVNPDIVVLCINPHDPVDFIKRNINYLESINSCKVLALVMYPLSLFEGYMGLTAAKKQINDEQFDSIKSMISKVTDIPVYKLDRKVEMDMLFKNIIEYFAE